MIPPTPTPAPEGLLAYPEYDSTRQTFAIKIYNLAQKQVIDTIDQASQPAISPEGKQIAYRSWDPSALNLLRETIGTSGPAQRVSSLSESNRPQWRRDNQRIIFTRVGFKDIRHVDDTGVRTPGQATTPAWLPDGRLIFNGWFSGNDYGLIITDEAGGNPDQLTRHPNDLTPAPSPNGQKVAFMSDDRHGNWEIYLLDIKSLDITRLTNHPARDGLPIFSPDGSQVAFVSDRGEQWGIWLLDWQRPGTEKLLLPIPGGLDGTIADVNQELQPHWSLESISWWDK